MWKSEVRQCGGEGGEAVWRRVSWVGVEESELGRCGGE